MIPQNIRNKIINQVRLLARELRSPVSDLTIGAIGILDDTAIRLLIRIEKGEELSQLELSTLYHSLSPDDRQTYLGGAGTAWFASISKTAPKPVEVPKIDTEQPIKLEPDILKEDEEGWKFELIGYDLWVRYPNGNIENLGRVVGQGGGSSTTTKISDGGVEFSDTAPDLPSTKPFWYNTTNGNLYVSDKSSPNPQWLLIGGSGGALPSGGTSGQVLTKNSDVEGDASWQDIQSTSFNNLDGGTASSVYGGTFNLDGGGA